MSESTGALSSNERFPETYQEKFRAWAKGRPLIQTNHAITLEQAADHLDEITTSLLAKNAEIERLKAALKDIASHLDESYRLGCLERMLGDKARAALSGGPNSAHETKPEPDVGALNRQLCEAEGHVFSRFAMHHCLRCEAAVTPGGYLAYTSSQKAGEKSCGG